MDMVNRLIQIAKGISLSLGETCEAVVHDRDHRIAYIANGHIPFIATPASIRWPCCVPWPRWLSGAAAWAAPPSACRWCA